MKIAIIGATGGTGQHFVAQALQHDHTVTALVRSPQKLAIEHPQLEMIAGDALHLADVRGAVGGKDAIFCALGMGAHTGKATIRREGTRQIVTALAELGEAPHLVVLSSLGVGDSKPQLSLPMRIIIPFILRHPFADHQEQEAIVSASALPWTILRPTSLNDAPARGSLHVTRPPEPVNVQPSVPRADVARFALTTIEERSYLHQAVTLTSPPAAR